MNMGILMDLERALYFWDVINPKMKGSYAAASRPF